MMEPVAVPAPAAARAASSPAMLLEAVWLSPVAFALLDPALGITAANPALVAILSRTPGPGDALPDLLPPWLSDAIAHPLRELFVAGPCATPAHLRVVGPSGLAWTTIAYASPRSDCLYVAIVLPAGPGDAARSSVDLEDALQVAVDRWDAAVRRQEELHAQLDALFAAAPIGMALFDRHLRFARANEALARINGRPVEAHLGRELAEVVPELATAELLEGYRAVLERGESAVDVPVSGRTAAEPDRLRHFCASRYPVRVRGEIVGVGTVVREVTAEREAELYRRDVLGIVGHDLRTPLHAIRGCLALALRSASLDAGTRAKLERAERVTGRMTRIVNDLLDYTLSQSPGGMAVALQLAPALPICRDAVAELRAASPGRTVRLVADRDAPGLVAVADPGRIHQALTNLLSNAVRYSPPGSRVTLRLTSEPGRIAFAVENEGPPIPPDLLPTLFEPFRRGDGIRASDGGVGLGLHIVRSIARAHRGDVSAASTDAGTGFRLWIPRYVDA